MISLTLPDHAKALNICRTPQGWQASLEVATGTFRVRVGDTAEEAVRELLVPSLPPVPY